MTLANTHVEDYLTKEKTKFYNNKDLMVVYKEILNTVLETGYTEPFMSDFIRESYGLYNSVDLTYLLEKYTQPLPAFLTYETDEEPISLFGLPTDEENLSYFIDDINTEFGYNDPEVVVSARELYPLDVFGNFALLTGKATERELAIEYTNKVCEQEQKALSKLNEKEIEEPYIPFQLKL